MTIKTIVFWFTKQNIIFTINECCTLLDNMIEARYPRLHKTKHNIYNECCTLVDYMIEARYPRLQDN